MNTVSVSQAMHVDELAIHPGAIGAIEISKDHVPLIELYLGVKAADTFVIQPDTIALFAPDRDGSGEFREDQALIHAINDLESNCCHRTSP